MPFRSGCSLTLRRRARLKEGSFQTPFWAMRGGEIWRTGGRGGTTRVLRPEAARLALLTAALR